MGLIKEFREFAIKGNMVDMAVGIIIGSAFGGIVTSLIKDVVMPVVGLAGNVDFTNAYLPLSEKVRQAVESTPGLKLEDARGFGPVLAYGSFITVAINFLILAFVIFIMVKMINTARSKLEKAKEAAPPPGPTAEQVLLTEIRDTLRAQR